MNKWCIYKITNTINNKVYFGRTNNFKQRKSDHIKHMKNKIHSNIYLQNDLKIYNYNVFEFKIIKQNITTKKEATKIEENYILKHSNVYNINIGDKLGKETKIKIGKGNKGKIRSTKMKRKISKNHADVSGKNNPNYGIKKTTLSKQKQSKTRKQKIKCGKIKIWNKNKKGVQKAWNKNLPTNQQPRYGKGKISLFERKFIKWKYTYHNYRGLIKDLSEIFNVTPQTIIKYIK